MAGADMSGGTFAGTQEVPATGGAEYRSKIGLPTTVTVAASAHLGDDKRAEGVAYPETPGIAVTTRAYPAGTSFPDSTPGEGVN